MSKLGEWWSKARRTSEEDLDLDSGADKVSELGERGEVAEMRWREREESAIGSFAIITTLESCYPALVHLDHA